VLGGLLGLWFVRQYRDEALILITMVLGTQMIILGLGLSTSSNWTAIVALCLALFGIVRQYADYSGELDSDFSQNAGEYQSPIGQAP
jgi:choline-glycine betaine transporter